MEIGKIVKEKRKLKKLTQLQLANEIGVSMGHISMIENGQRQISLELLEKLARVLDTRPYIIVIEEMMLQKRMNPEEKSVVWEILKKLDKII